MLQVNIPAVLHLTYLYLPAMIERRRGNILIVSSTAAFQAVPYIDRKSTRLNSSHVRISYAVFCLKKKNKSGSSFIGTEYASSSRRRQSVCIVAIHYAI